MLPQQRRIDSHTFSQIMTQGQKYHSAHFIIVAITNSISSTHSRWAASVSKKIATTAVKRNSIRRKINGFLQKNKEIIPLHASGIIFAKQGMETLGFKEYSDELQQLFKRVK